MEILTTVPSQPQSNQYYQAVISAIKRIWKYKFLWFWGVLLPAGMSLNYNIDKKELGRTDPGMIYFYVQQYWISYSTLIIIGTFTFFAITIIVWIFSAIARGGIINSLNNLQELKKESQNQVNTKNELRKIWQLGKLRFWSIIKLDLLFSIISIILLVIAVPPIYFAIKSGNPTTALFVVFLAMVVFIPIVFILIFTKAIGLIYIALAKEKPLKSIEHSYNLLLRNKKEAAKLIMTFFLLAIAIGVAASLVFAIIGVLLLFGFSATLSLVKFSLIATVARIIFGAILAAIILLAKSITALWHQDIWLWWVKKISSIRAPEAETVTQLAEENLADKKPKIAMEDKIN